jgi:hypothetical protein
VLHTFTALEAFTVLTLSRYRAFHGTGGFAVLGAFLSSGKFVRPQPSMTVFAGFSK